MENIEKRMTILDFINQPFISLRTKNSLIFINEHYTYMDELSVVKLGKFRKVGIQTIFEIQKYYPNLKNELQVISNYEIGKYLKRNRKYKPTNTPTKKMSNIEDKIQMGKIKNIDDIKDLSINILDKLVLEGYIKDCTDTDDQTECEVQDLIIEVLCEKLHIKNE